MTYLILDLGSSSIRAILFDENHNPIKGAITRQPHQFDTSVTGAVTADATQLQHHTELCIDEILHHPAAKNIQAVGMACFVGNMLGVDKHNRPLTPLFTYADTQAQSIVEDLKDHIDEPNTHQRTGCLISAAYRPTQLYWLKQQHLDLFNQVTQWTDIATHIYRHWFAGDVPCSYSVASWSGLLNRSDLTWDTDWLNFLGMSAEQFTPLADYSDTQQGLSEAYVNRWKQLQDVPFYLAIGDGAAANIGSGATQESQLALTIGTTAAVRTITTQARTVPNGLWAYRVDRTHHLVGGATTEGGSIYQWLQDTLQLPNEELETRLKTREPGSHHLTFIPLLAGERSPGYNAHATGTIHGIRLSTTPIDIAQAALESIAIRLSIIASLLSTEQSSELVFAGGNAVAASPAWVQMIANAFNRPVAILNEPEVTAKGVALLISQSLAETVSPQIDQIMQPNPQHVHLMTELREQHIDLYRKFYG